MFELALDCAEQLNLLQISGTHFIRIIHSMIPDEHDVIATVPNQSLLEIRLSEQA